MPSVINSVSQSCQVVLLSLLGMVGVQAAQTAEDYDEYWSSGVENTDPWEKVNRPIFHFNDTIDTWVLKPVAKGYQYVTPKFVRTGVRNVFQNVGEFRNVSNSLLQGRFHQASIGTARFMFNTTFGVLGVFDVATPMGLEHTREDFGLTLGRWGVPSGPYVVLPFLGSNSARDASALFVDFYTSPYPYISNKDHGWIVAGIQTVSIRTDLLPAENLIVGDRYIFIRNAYLQNREYLVKDGEVEDDF